MNALNAYIVASALIVAFNAAIWSSKFGLNLVLKLAFIGVAFWGAVMVAKVVLA